MLVRPCKKKWNNVRTVVLQSDDWGYCGWTPDNKVFKFLKPLLIKRYGRKGIVWGQSTLESPDDMECLFAVLEKYKDHKGNHPIIQAGYIMSNPDYENMKQTEYRHYLDITLPNIPSYWNRGNIISKALEGMERGVWKPVFHGLSHFNIADWIKRLQQDETTRTAAAHACFFGDGQISNFEFGNVYDKKKLGKNIRRGLKIFKSVFGKQADSAIMPAYIWPIFLEKILAKEGISILEGKNCQMIQQSVFQRIRGKILNFMGFKDAAKIWQIKCADYRPDIDLYYLSRNVFFEPYLESLEKGKKKEDIVSEAFRQIVAVWERGEPAVIITHRLNYANLNSFEVNKGRHCLDLLLGKLLQCYPDIVFNTDIELIKNC